MPTTAPADEAQLPDIRSVAPDLSVPPLLEGREPAPGCRVRVKVEGSSVSHVLYLPEDWRPGARYPVLVELAGNGTWRLAAPMRPADIWSVAVARWAVFLTMRRKMYAGFATQLAGECTLCVSRLERETIRDGQMSPELAIELAHANALLQETKRINELGSPEEERLEVGREGHDGAERISAVAGGRRGGCRKGRRDRAPSVIDAQELLRAAQKSAPSIHAASHRGCPIAIHATRARGDSGSPSPRR